MIHSWQSEEFQNVFKKLKSSENGLSESVAKKRVEKYGLNKLPDQKEKSILKIFISQFLSPLIYILIFAGVVALLMHEYVDSVVIFIIILLNSLIGFFQELKAEKGIEALKKVSALYCTVLRNGVEKRIKAENIVPGDILVLSSGDKIGADVRLIESVNLRTDESLLTGESVPANKKIEEVEPEEHIYDADNMAFSGTLVVDGRGKGIVVGTGIKTEIGKIANKVQNEIKAKTPLQKNLENLSKTIGKISLVLVLPIFLLGIFQGREIFEIFEMCVSLAVSAIPEGLPIIITITLALGINRMLKNNALIRRLPIVEVLGSTDVICTDKTGTITTNQITIRKIYMKYQKFIFAEEIEDESKEEVYTVDKYCNWEENGIEDKKCQIKNHQGLENFLERSVLCCDATEEYGDPTEQALIFGAKKIGLDASQLKTNNKRINEIPFSSDYKYMVTHIQNQGFIMKGAVEEVIKKCQYISDNGSSKKLDQNEKEKILKLNKNQAKDGYRVLALACKEVDNQAELSDKSLKDFVFVGLLSMIDPPRPEVDDAIQASYNAGVRVIMITGDHALTAKSIAENVGIESAGVIEGKQIQEMEKEELKKVVEEYSVYARVTSEDKLRILKALQENGHVVGMGGDGVNDAPAIKKAEIGFAVGSGTDLTKEVADMVLLDDNFATIPKVIKEGRVIYRNIRNFIKLLLALNFDEILVVLVSLFLGIPLFFAPIHILWINLLSDGFPATALTLDRPVKEVMNQNPRDPRNSILHGIWPFIMTAGFFDFIGDFIIFSYNCRWWKLDTCEGNLIEARTMVFVGAVLFELLLVFICRTKSFAFGKKFFENKYLLLAVLSSVLMLIAAIYTPLFNTLFKTVPLAIDDWIFLISTVFAIAGVTELFKLIYYKNKEF